MNKVLAAIAVIVSAAALYLPLRTQAFVWADLEGRRLRMFVAGEAHTTVVFESGGGGTLEMWGKVQPAVSRFARTVSYDRAGMGLSDYGPMPRDGRRIAADLRRALRAAGIEPPYVLAGASMGGPYVRVFAGMYPEDVIGVVLVDPTVTAELTGAPVPRVPVLLIDAVSPLEIPFATNAVRDRRAGNRAEIEADSAAYRDWIGIVPGGRLIVAHDTGHNVAVERPGIVIDAIRHIVAEVSRR